MADTGDQDLFRILSFDRVVDIFEKKQFYFANPSKWDDPYETYLKHKYLPRTFAQCWCSKGMSDAMWRIYSPDRLGVRIRSTREKLMTMLASVRAQTGVGTGRVKVKYASSKEIGQELKKIADQLNVKYKLETALTALKYKRTAFIHESEVRFIICDTKSALDGTDGVKVDVKPHDIIDSILVDPRAPAAFLNAYKYYFKDKLRFAGPVSKSSLYEGKESIEV